MSSEWRTRPRAERTLFTGSLTTSIGVTFTLAYLRGGTATSPPTENEARLSIVELAYRRAMARGMPVFMFLLHEDVPWPPRWVDGADDRERIKRFREEVLRDATVSYFRTPDELGQNVATKAVRAERPELRRVREGGVVRRVDRAQARLVGEKGRREGHQDGGHEDPQPDHPRRVMPELAPRPRQRPAAADPRDPPGGWGGDGAHAGLARGSR